MATKETTKEAVGGQATVEQKLRLIYKVQVIDSRLAEVENLKGELPLEVRDLRDEIEGLHKRLEKLNEEKKRLEKELSNEQNKKEELKIKLQRLQEKLKDAQTAKEYNTFEKGIEDLKLDIQLSEKHINELSQEIKTIEEKIKETQEKIQELQKKLEEKEKELESVIAETEKEENFLKELRKKAVEDVIKVDERLYRAYERIRNKYKNRRAVVTFERSACGGCYMWVPPQRQLEVRKRDAIYTCENCGRIFIDEELAHEVEKEFEEILKQFHKEIEHKE
ncbi:MAG: hypothetical protein GXO48_05795 [Chlorobi bacterium]|nr:hypothetical protein [Chlorobiota bacterium]